MNLPGLLEKESKTTMVKRDELQYLPLEAGCYVFRNKAGEVLYVGKAKQLRKRVGSYFARKDLDGKTALLVREIEDIDVIITSTEVDALLLENNLIKKYYPPFNIDLKDSRRYAYLLLHQDPLPWIEVVRSREEKGEYYGPFVSGAIRKLIMDVVTRTFRILTRKPSPKLRRTIDPTSYAERVFQARQLLKGHVDELIEQLEEEMKISSKKQYYEYALTLRNRIGALKTLKEKQHIEMTKLVDAHIINYQRLGDDIYLLVFTIRRGVLEDKQSYAFGYYEDFFDDFLLQYYDTAPIPQEVVVPHAVDEALGAYLTEKSGRSVKVLVPERGDKKELLALVERNIMTTFFAGREGMTQLQELLGLEKLPQRIECFDISHLAGTNTVASMVSFLNGLPNKKEYRKFKIRSQTKGDDYLAMKEVLTRRYSGSLRTSLRNPDLIVIDGGLGQLGAGMTVLADLRLKIPVISLAKREEEIYVPGKEEPIRAGRKHRGLQLLQAIRDEAHRFALTYQRSLRGRALEEK